VCWTSSSAGFSVPPQHPKSVYFCHNGSFYAPHDSPRAPCQWRRIICLTTATDTPGADSDHISQPGQSAGALAHVLHGNFLPVILQGV